MPCTTTRAGTPGRDVHRRAKEVIDASEFSGRFIHGTGHSIGLDVHDGPGLSEASEITLAPGMIMTIEPVWAKHVPTGEAELECWLVKEKRGTAEETTHDVDAETVEDWQASGGAEIG